MTSRLRTRESGFTIIELLIVIVVIGILAGLVLNVFTGIQEDARDAERKTDLEAVEGHLEAYAAKNGTYPTTANVADTAFVAAEFKGLDPDALLDPTSGASYTYTATPSTPACDNTSGNECTGYTLSADLEKDGFGAADADSDTADDVRTNNL
jgi:prepilin-type N-terminal cleavage/methylation domain-containing protein